jgi:hypothetical protein
VSSSVLRGYTGSLDNARVMTRTALAAPQAAALTPLQLRRHLWRHLHSRRGLQVSSSHAQTHSQEVCLDLARAVYKTYEARFLRCLRTWASHDAAATEFGQFLESFFGANYAEHWLRCTPDVVLAFIHLHLLPRHSGRSGQLLAPSTLRGYLSSLSQCFERLLPDLGSWDGLLQHGNPVRSFLVSRSLEAYAHSCSVSGIMERSTVPITAAKLRTLLFCLDEELCGSLPNQQRWLMARDAAFFACLWASCHRGIDILRLTWRQLFAPPPLLYLVEFWASADPAQMVLPPGILTVPA